MTHGPRTLTLLTTLALAACGRDAPRRPHPAPRDVARVPEAPPPSPPPPPPAPAGEPFRVDRAAALSGTKVFAVASQRLWRVVGGAWRELPIAGATVRDVTAGFGSLWVLARGEGPNVGRVIVLRAPGGGEDLAVTMDFLTPAAHEPRALAVVTDHEFYIGGANPSLVRARLTGSAQMQVYNLPSPVASLVYMPDAMMAVRYEGGGVVHFRWGEAMAIERPGYHLAFAGTRESLMVLRDGTVQRGPVYELALPTDRIAGASNMTPAAAATLPDQRVLEVGPDGRTLLHDGRRWGDVEGAAGGAEVVSLSAARALTEGLCVRVDRDGSVYELVGARWEPRASATADAPR